MSRLQGRYSEVQDQSLDPNEARNEGEGFGYHSQSHYAASPLDFQHDYENSTAARSPGQQYKPTALRWPFLLTLLLALLTTLAFLSYAVTSLPVVGSRDASERVEARSLYQSSTLTHSGDLRIHTSTIEQRARRAEVTAYERALQTSPPSFYHPPGEPRDVREGEITESSTPISVPTTTPSFSDGVETTPSSSDGVVTTSGSSDESEVPEETKASPDYGDIGTRTVTVPDTSTTTGIKKVTANPNAETPTIVPTKDKSDYGDIGTRTVTVPDTSTTTQAEVSEDPSDSVEITTSVTTAEVPFPTETESDSGEIGSKPINNQPTSSTTQIETVTHVTLGVTTITDTQGLPVDTSTRTLSPISSLQTSALTNSEGRVTATQIVTVTVTPSVSVKTDSSGNPTATVVTYPISPSVHTAVYVIGGGHYFIGAFLPTLVSSILAIAVRILDTNAKSFQPWHALTHERGALGRDSLCLETSGWRSLVMGLHSLLGGQAVISLTSLLSLSSAVLIAVSAGAITLDLRGGGCKIGGSSASNCAYVLSVSPIVSKAALGILAVMCLTTIFLVVMVGRWRLGVYTNPWSMCTLASLSAHPDVRQLVLDAATGVNAEQAKSQLTHHDFKLDYFLDAKGNLEYGIVPHDRFSGARLSTDESAEFTPDGRLAFGRGSGTPFFMLGISGRLCMLFMLSGVLILVLYYAQTGGDTAFERFIDSDTFGVRVLFSSLGVIISLFWSSFLSAVATMTSYQVLAERPREASQSILRASPTNAFSGLRHAAQTRRSFLGIVSLASIFAQFLSIFLSNVPYRVTQTFLVSQLSIWTAVGIMSFMILIILSSFFVKWPDMPVNPSTIAGAMYYVSDISVVDKFEGLSTMDKKERDRTVTDMALLYEFGETGSAPGSSRIGLIVLDSREFIP
ncbi:hypothetical protein F5X98DRAFT_109463 [Xylaria grammica]|nr:hypothetical protein F5X98DRAFT_109463 [Xylaria grammica]